jgi:hypothetical protein
MQLTTGGRVPRRTPSSRELVSFGSMDSSPTLSQFERELLELASNPALMGVSTSDLVDEMLDRPHERIAVEAGLKRLVGRGLTRTERDVGTGVSRPGNMAGRGSGRGMHRVYEDDWWTVTNAGRTELGLAPLPPPTRERAQPFLVRAVRSLVLRLWRKT